jgi:hypothetical protein
MKPRLYLETTIPSYLTSRPSRDMVVAEKQQVTRQWWEERRQQFDVCVSQFVIDEASAGDATMARERLEAIKGLTVLEATAETLQLAIKIMQLGLIPERAGLDAAHIATATASRMDFLMTWNCAHIANAIIARRIAGLCKESGFECPVICTPYQLLGEDL